MRWSGGACAILSFSMNLNLTDKAALISGSTKVIGFTTDIEALRELKS
jgi:hypothetical protein